MENDKRMVELLADMLIKLDKLDIVAQRLESLEGQQLKTTNAIESLTSLLQKAIIEPAQNQAQRLTLLEERVSQIEQKI